MPETRTPINRIAVAANPKLPEAAAVGGRIAAWIKDQGREATSGLLYDEELNQRVKAGGFDLLIALGGDGTMLRAGHLCGPCGVPILGINLGHFGFLMEINHEQWPEVLPRLLAGDYWLEERMMLLAQQWRAGSVVGRWEVVNEVVVGRGQIVRPVLIDTSVDGFYLTTYTADAMLAATPTGSTAYALAAGGPILPPQLRNILIVPVAPHLSLERAIVLAEGSTVTFTVHFDHQASLCVDGQAPIGLADGDRVSAQASEHSVQFVRFQDPGYFYRNLTPHMYRNSTSGNPK
jgi:NAD+ kinase